MSNRRDFIVQASLLGSALVTKQSFAQGAMLTESDPQAVALGYKADAGKVDKTKYPKFTVSQKCDGCALYQAKAGAASGPCTLFPGKQVTAKGWCSAYAKKA